MLRVELTSDWSFDRLATYGPQITAAMASLAKRFPGDATVKSLFEAVETGAHQLWIVRDGEEFRQIVLTQIECVPATGHRRLRVYGYAGEGGIESLPLVATIEDWAREQGAREIQMTGRIGWARPLAKEGYRQTAAIYSKMLEAG